MNSTPSFESLAAQAVPLGEQLRNAKQTIAVAESSTAGLLSAALLSVAGASAYYRGGSVIYTLEARRTLLGLRGSDVAGLEPLSEPMVQRFAEVARAQLDSTWALAELGAAGPTGAHYGHPAGSCVLAVVGPKILTIELRTGSNDRLGNMLRFSQAALELLGAALAADAA
jgi:nicotinamide-nucleotide amidase